MADGTDIVGYFMVVSSNTKPAYAKIALQIKEPNPVNIKKRQ